jgi:RND family efflux transporter MFP subunit
MLPETGFTNMKVNLLGKKLLPLVILGVMVLLAVIALKNPPEANRKPTPAVARMSVETHTISEAPYQIQLHSYGTVRPRTRSMLVSQVSGQVVWVSPQFRDGGVFKAGDILLRIDKRDYQADARVAEAALLDSQQALAEEQALSLQAREDWQRLGNQGEAPDLVLRKPQLQAAKARVISAEATLSKAQLNLERTELKAPFDGRVLETEIDLGQVVANNSQLAEIYASDYVEIRLPLRNRDLSYISLPGDGIDAVDTDKQPANVRIQSSLGKQRGWDAHLVRTESAIDENSQQLHVIAQIDNPFDDNGNQATPLKIGEYVTAKIAGIQLDKAIVIPNKTIYQGSYVYLVENGLLMRRDIDIAWQNDSIAVISSGLKPQDQLVTTPMGQVSSGTRVNIVDDSQGANSIASPTGHDGAERPTSPPPTDLAQPLKQPHASGNRS